MNSKLALITFLDGSGGSIDNTLPQPGFPVDPGYGQNAPGHPWLPGHLGGPRPDAGLPGGPPTHPWLPGHLGGPRPDNTLPGGGNYPTTGPVPPPVTIDNTLPPSAPPPTISLPIVLPPSTKPIEPDALFELKYSVRFGWCLVPVEDDAPPTATPKK